MYIKKIFQIIKQALTSSVDPDTSPYPNVQVSYNGKTSKAIRMSSYGLCTNPPESSNVVLLSSNGQESNKYALIDDMPNRFKNLAEGEVVVYNYMSGSYMYLKENGDIDVECKNDNTVNIIGDCDVTIGGNATVDITGTADVTTGGNATVTTTGTITATATVSSIVTAPTITLNGNVTIAGTLTQTGGGAATFSGDITTATGEVTASGVDLSSHVHSGVEPGSSDTGGPV